jgi:hypothetical protein
MVSLLGGGPGLYFDFARLSFHVPIHGLLSATAIRGNAVANTTTEQSNAVVVKESLISRVMMFLPVVAQEGEGVRPGILGGTL